MASKQDQAGKIMQYGYDADSRLTSVTQTNNGVNLVTQYGYHEVGNRIRRFHRDPTKTFLEKHVPVE